MRKPRIVPKRKGRNSLSKVTKQACKTRLLSRYKKGKTCFADNKGDLVVACSFTLNESLR